MTTQILDEQPTLSPHQVMLACCKWRVAMRTTVQATQLSGADETECDHERVRREVHID